MRLLPSFALDGGLCALPAAAHVTLDPAAIPVGAHARAALRVPHGCAGAATTAIAVEIPEGLHTARPMAKPGWRLAIERRRLAEPGGLLALPVTQPCEDGRAEAWVERPAPGQTPQDLARPAPAMRLTPR